MKVVFLRNKFNGSNNSDQDCFNCNTHVTIIILYLKKKFKLEYLLNY